MKKPSAYLPFFGNDFFASVAGYPDAVVAGYLRALWHYWHHTGCEGLPDDDDYLQRICVCHGEAWPKTKAVIFDNRYHFRLMDGIWQQPRCQEEFKRSMDIGQRRKKVGLKGAQSRWQKA